jgi:prevent-host-death family protein
MRATAKDLRLHSRELLATVARGEEVFISFHGKPVAKLVPLPTNKKRSSVLKHSAGFGMWKGRPEMDDPTAYVGRLRQGRRF